MINSCKLRLCETIFLIFAKLVTLSSKKCFHCKTIPKISILGPKVAIRYKKYILLTNHKYQVYKIPLIETPDIAKLNA